MKEELFSRKIVDGIRAKLQKENLDKISVKELIVIVAAYFNDQMGIVGEQMKSIEIIGEQMKAIKKAGWALAISIFAGIVVYIGTQFIP